MITLQKVKKINHEFYFSTNLILNKSEIKKTIRKIKGPEIKKKNILGLMGKPTKPVNWVTGSTRQTCKPSNGLHWN